MFEFCPLAFFFKGVVIVAHFAKTRMHTKCLEERYMIMNDRCLAFTVKQMCLSNAASRRGKNNKEQIRKGNSHPEKGEKTNWQVKLV